MSKLSFRHCPVCGKELDTGKIKFPAPHPLSERDEVKYYSDKTSEKYEGHPVKKIFQMYDKIFTADTFGKDNPAGYCKECDRIFAEFF